MKIKLLALIGLSLLAFMFNLSCFLEADKTAEEFPPREDQFFKVKTDEMGIVKELNEQGKLSGRVGFFVDYDRDCEMDEVLKTDFFKKPLNERVIPSDDFCGELFAQPNYPKLAVYAIGFDLTTGYANDAMTVMAADIKAGQTYYEIPVKPLTYWIKANDVARAKKVGDKTYIYWTDPVSGEEDWGVLTGKAKVFTWTFKAHGSVSVETESKADASNSGGEDLKDEADVDGDSSYDKADDGETPCDRWQTLCSFEDSCNLLKWSVEDCKNWFDRASYPLKDIKEFAQCAYNCVTTPGIDCESFENCRNECWEKYVVDVYGCNGGPGHAPAIYGLFFYKYEDGKWKGFNPADTTLSTNDRVAVFLQYRDGDADLKGGGIFVRFNKGNWKAVGGALPELGSDSFASNLAYGFELDTPLPSGTTTDVEVKLVDGCGLESNIFSFSLTVGSGGGGGGKAELANFVDEVQAYEYFESKITPFNQGKGFLAREVIPDNFSYCLSDVNICLIQTIIGLSLGSKDKYMVETLTELNAALVLTTQDTNGTKFDPVDDSEASIFYFDQTTPPGLLLIWGDEGWNLFPQGPYGSASDVNFVWGAFNDYVIYQPTHPFFVPRNAFKSAYRVNWEIPYKWYCKDLSGDKKKECEDYVKKSNQSLCGYWANWFETNGVTLKDADGDSLEDAKEIEDLCDRTFEDAYWSCVIACARRGEEASLSCFNAQECVDSCANKWGDVIEDSGVNDKPLYFTIEVDTSYYCPNPYKTYLNCVKTGNWSSSYCQGVLKEVFSKGKVKSLKSVKLHCTQLWNELSGGIPRGTMKVGMYASGLGGVPGGYITYDPRISTYKIPFPYGPWLPERILSKAALGYFMTQPDPAIFSKQGIRGTSAREPNFDYDELWYYLFGYSFNWISPWLEGWWLMTVSGNYLQDIFDPGEIKIKVTYGNMSATTGKENWLP